MAVTVCVVACLFPAKAAASWLGYRNDTAQPVTVQTSVLVNGRVVRGTPHVLYPGEVAWDSVAAPGPRQISIYDPKAGNRLVAQDSINIGNVDIFLSVQLQAVQPAPGKAAVPVVRLVPTRVPVLPGGAAPKAAESKATPKAAPTPVPPKSTLPPTVPAAPPASKTAPPPVPPKAAAPPVAGPAPSAPQAKSPEPRQPTSPERVAPKSP